jgi:hypothetical protein
MIKKGCIIFLTVFFCSLQYIVPAQITFEDRYLKTQADIASSSTYSNIVAYMKSKNYTLTTRENDDEDKSEYLVFTGNYKQLVVFNYSKSKELLFIKSNLLSLNVVFCEIELEANKFQKSTVNEEIGGEKWAEVTWKKTGYSYQFMLEHVKENICWLYLYTPALYNKGKAAAQKEPVVAPKKMYDYSTIQKFADSLNAHLFSAEINSKAAWYIFSALGKIDFEKRSIKFIVKNNALYAKMHLPKDGECDYGIKEVEAKYVNWGGALAGSNHNLIWVNFEYSYSCNGSNYSALHIVLHKPNAVYLQETLEKLKSCCQ